MKEEYDLIIIGGGASGSGIALDASLRGLKCLLIEKNDFSQGTSSRSTKMVHGGVRYLEMAIKKLDYSQYKLVKEGLKERFRLLNNASFLAKPLELITPLYKYYEIPYIYVGLFIYDLISGNKGLGKSKIVSKNTIINTFPYIKKDNLKAGVKYFDGIFNDSRMVMALLQTAKQNNCDVYNYHEAIEIIYKDEKIDALKVKNNINNEIKIIKTKYLINACGVFSDSIRLLDDNKAKKLLTTSSGIHIVLDKKYLPNDIGIMIPKTKDGRVLFMLPYKNMCLVGTTDEKSNIIFNPKVDEKDIIYLLEHIKDYFGLEITKKEILSSWVGLRPLVLNENSNNTKEIVREHIIKTSKSGMVSILGGKWTTYRKMAEDTLDVLINNENINNLKKCITKDYKLIGSQIKINNINNLISSMNLDLKLEKHLLDTYGDNIVIVYEYIKKYGYAKLHKNYEILIAEVYYCIDYEFVKKADDFLIRRSNLAMINNKDSKLCIEIINKIISNYKQI